MSSAFIVLTDSVKDGDNGLLSVCYLRILGLLPHHTFLPLLILKQHAFSTTRQTGFRMSVFSSAHIAQRVNVHCWLSSVSVSDLTMPQLLLLAQLPLQVYFEAMPISWTPPVMESEICNRTSKCFCTETHWEQGIFKKKMHFFHPVSFYFPGFSFPV